MFVTWLVSHVEMWPYVDSAELRLESQELTAEWILLLDIAPPRSAESWEPAARSAASSATATHAQAVHLAMAIGNKGWGSPLLASAMPFASTVQAAIDYFLRDFYGD